MTSSTAFIFINLMMFSTILIRDVNVTDCNWGSQYLCGDTCLGLPQSCFCGNEVLKFSDTWNQSCCNIGQCSNINAALGAQCQGQIQYRFDSCHESCHQEARFGLITVPCAQGQPECYLQIYGCRGQAQCQDQSDLEHCSVPKDCSSNFQHTNCGQMKDAKFENYGCKHLYGETIEYFECTNRMDKAEVLFAKPSVVPTKNHLVGTNFNQALLFDDNLIYCGTHNFSYQDFFDLKLTHPNDPCQLKDKSFVTLDRLWSRLIGDFSFKMSWKMEELFGDERRNQLVFNCLDLKQPFHCGTSTDQDLCTTELRVCDGIANCPLAEDEDFDLCQDKFSEFATVKCTKKDLYNLNITIKAIKCDGKIECQAGEDEDRCTLPDNLLLIILGIIGLISTILAIWIWKLTTRNLQRIDHNVNIHLFKNFDQLHQTDHLKSQMKRVQGYDSAKSINVEFIQMEEKLHDGQWNQTVCCMKNNLDIGTFAKVLRDSEDATCFDSIKQTRIFQTCSRLRILRLMKIIRPVMFHMFDLVKDSLLLIQISLTQNDGLGQTPYIRAISLAFLGSIIIPWTLSSLRLVSKGPQILFGSNKLIAWVGLLLVSPVYPFVLITYDSVLEEANNDYEVPSELLETTKLHVSEFIQADVGLESHLQIVLSTILLLIAHSNTKTVNGLEALFEQEAIFYLSPILALTVSVAISLYSCISSHIKGITKKREYWTSKSYFVILLYATITITVRVLSYVLYFTPSLGGFP